VAEAALRRATDEAAIVASAELYGCMSGVLELTLSYMKTRVQFGVPIGSFQALQHRAVDLWIQKELSGALVGYALGELDKGVSTERLAELASRAKARCSEAGIDLGRECIRLHGAIGFTDEYDAGLYLKRALVLSAWLGNSYEQRRRFDASRATHANADADMAARMKKIKPADLPGTPGNRPRDTDWNKLTDDQFRVEAAAFFDTHFPRELRFQQRKFKKEEIPPFMKKLSESGWLAPAWPRRWGGMELAPSKQVIYLEERERIGGARVLEQGITMVGPMLMKFGSEKQQDEYIPRIMSTEHIWCQGYSEPNAGSDLAGLQTHAVRDGDHWVINGSKIWTSGATEANHIYVLARTDKEAKKQSGISFFLVDIKTPGLTLRPIQTLPGEKPFCQTFFDNVRVPAENMVGQVNQGWTIAKGLLGFERLNSGTPRRAQYPLNKVREIAMERGLWEDPEFRSKYTKLEMDLHDLGMVFAQYADVVSSGANPGPGISMLKIWASETNMRLNGLMVEAAGAAGGLSGELEFGKSKVDVHFSYCLLFPGVIASGTNDIQRNVLAKRVLGLN
jgi:alkylation response protein AidB-like acyl-CoA dehydrogenase